VFQEAGRVGAGNNLSPVSEADVELYMKSAPPGFTMEGQQLVLLEGYGHQALGFVEFRRTDGDCDEWFDGDPHPYLVAMKLLRELAASKGGTAVVYVQSVFAEGMSRDQLAVACGHAGMPQPYGFGQQDKVLVSGWVVRLGKPADPSASQSDL